MKASQRKIAHRSNVAMIIYLFFTLSALGLIANTAQSQNQAADFFSPPDMLTAALSPDGEQVAAIRYAKAGRRLVLIQPNTQQETSLLDTASYFEGTAQINTISWLDSRYLAVQLSQERQGVKDLLSTKATKHLLVIDTQNIQHVRSVRTPGWFVHALPDSPGEFLYAKSGRYSKVYRLQVEPLLPDEQQLGKLDRIDGGQFKKSNELAAIKGYAVRWYFDQDRQLHSVLHYENQHQLTLSYATEDRIPLPTPTSTPTSTPPVQTQTVAKDKPGKKNKKKKTTKKKRSRDGKKSKDEVLDPRRIKTWNTADDTETMRFIPIAAAGDGQSYYCFDSEEEESRSVYKVNLLTQEEALIYQTDAYEITDIIITPENNQFAGVQVLKNGMIQYEFLPDDNATQTVNQKTPAVSAVGLKSFISVSRDKSRAVQYQETHNQPGSFSFVNHQKNTKTPLGYFSSGGQLKFKSEQIEASLNVDGLDIPYFLNLPKSQPKAAKPLLVIPHGGPIGVFDDRYYNASVQFWVAKGYAVLRVNFRGSSGYSEALKNAGTGEWGGKMLLDISRVTEHVQARADINAERSCILGFSYGGYAATQLLIDRPDLYKCGASVAGVADLNLHIASTRFSKATRAWYKEIIGSPEEDFDKLKGISPIYQAEQMHQPLLIAHGRQDKTVDIEHAYRWFHVLSALNKPFEFYIDDDSDHHFSDSEKMIQLFEVLDRFIAEHL